jgi:hypothetical protein
MPRNRIALLIAAGLALGLSAAGPSWAQPPRTQEALALWIDFSYVTFSTPPRWLAFGPELEWRPAGLVSLNPEISLWLPDTLQGTFRIVPGLTANIHFKRIVLGGGIVARIAEWDTGASGWFVPKFQAGLLMGPARLALTIYVPGGTYDVIFGLTFGRRIRLGRPKEPED